ncbi:MAG: hypothetical protein UY16_C0044G0007 [Candidatus Gottesmanbacteria bacterium GW2011_GWA2_47_9]|uniref:Uncharacterized protein n=2 Tax=Candidatus Gottesmaniibacteriota TaxID=1752720 RepID=A0A0G1UMK7_9BACT|nr:MAG: hypothetical protein UY16_C0044G0007 [Candidatus Gottesmanbacteria bacterium GW2011_GWA2_47_9]KKU95452.1 MAG: hypothetical protein UY27_C0017G0007 [Candidatus Gottesmanbacteria bacterium GW2011_GWA1_48_13]
MSDNEMEPKSPLEQKRADLLAQCGPNEMVEPVYDIYDGYSPFENVEYTVKTVKGYRIVPKNEDGNSQE